MEIIKFQGKEFPIVNINLPFGEIKVSNESLNEALMNFDGSYVSEEARLIDEKIFYFVEAKVLRFCESKITKLILSEI